MMKEHAVYQPKRVTGCKWKVENNGLNSAVISVFQAKRWHKISIGPSFVVQRYNGQFKTMGSKSDELDVVFKDNSSIGFVTIKIGNYLELFLPSEEFDAEVRKALGTETYATMSLGLFAD